MTHKSVRVAAGIVLKDAQVFLTKRAEHAHQGGKWEFPGGKVEQGESLEQALSRELTEEIGITVLQSSEFMTITHDYPDKKVVLDFIKVTDFSGQPRGCEGQLFQWFNLTDLAQLDFPAANKAVIEKLLAAAQP